MRKRRVLIAACTAGLVLLEILMGCGGMPRTPSPTTPAPRPNILVIVSDDQSWSFTGAASDSVTRTPALDKLAQEGVLFSHAFAACPVCSPSRAALLTGQPIWRLREAANQVGPLDVEFHCYPDLLQVAGYRVGYTGKGWEPGDVALTSRSRSPAGDEFNQMGKWNPVANFEAFLDSVPQGTPFCFWWGSRYPHRPFAASLSVDDTSPLDSFDMPPIWPRDPAVLGDVARYVNDVRKFDREIGVAFGILEARGRLDNTLIVVTSDNGMPFPRAKANLYDLGTRVPLVVWWKNYAPAGRVIDDFVSLTDLAPTFLEAGGRNAPPGMTGSSLMAVLRSDKSGRIDTTRDFVVTARERHAPSREGSLGYPSRALRTYDYLYIRNYEPDRWPAGDPPNYGDIDSWDLSYPAPTKEYMMQHPGDPDVRSFFTLCFEKRPAEELYDLRADPYEIFNLLGAPPPEGQESGADYESVRTQLAERLDRYLIEMGDPRATGEKPLWDTYPLIMPRPPAPTDSAPATADTVQTR
jgi:arylsulfatase A-like enzyme